MKQTYLIFIFSFFLLFACSGPVEKEKFISQESEEEKLKIAVIPKGTIQFFWKSVHAGALKAGQNLGVEIIWQGPQKEVYEEQSSIMNEMIGKKINGIVLAPVDYWAMAEPINNAAAAGIPIVIIDSQVDSDEYSSIVATDNLSAGNICAKKFATLLNGKKKVIIMRFLENSASTTQRELGFIEGIKKYAPEVEIISSDRYSGGTLRSATSVAEELLKKYPDVEGIFCSNEIATFGMLTALQKTGKAGKVIFVGFDYNPELKEALKKDEIQVLAVQDPFKIGYLGVETMVKILKEEKYKKRVDTGINFITKENLNDPIIQALLDPKAEE
jgi:ribose transport system substrate-binding protein